MIKTIYAIYDKKNVSYMQIYVTENEVNLKRILGYAVNSGNASNFLFTNTEDFQLCKVGLFDDTNGEVKNLPVEIVCELLDFKKGQNNEREN